MEKGKIIICKALVDNSTSFSTVGIPLKNIIGFVESQTDSNLWNVILKPDCATDRMFNLHVSKEKYKGKIDSWTIENIG